MALGAMPLAAINDQAIACSTDLFNLRASASSGNEQVAVHVVVLGSVARAPGRCRQCLA